MALPTSRFSPWTPIDQKLKWTGCIKILATRAGQRLSILKKRLTAFSHDKAQVRNMMGFSICLIECSVNTSIQAKTTTWLAKEDTKCWNNSLVQAAPQENIEWWRFGLWPFFRLLIGTLSTTFIPSSTGTHTMTALYQLHNLLGYWPMLLWQHLSNLQPLLTTMRATGGLEHHHLQICYSVSPPWPGNISPCFIAAVSKSRNFLITALWEYLYTKNSIGSRWLTTAPLHKLEMALKLWPCLWHPGCPNEFEIVYI